MLWTETTTDDEARSLHAAMWGLVMTEKGDGSLEGRVPGPPSEGGQFWADAIDKLKNDPAARFAMAQRHLPLPAAWRESAIALRAMIRKARKDCTGYEAELRELHRLAAIYSFAPYGIIERIPYARLAALDLGYDRIGSEALPLLGKTDVKWMREAWGEPASHTTAADLYPDLFASERARVLTEDEAERKGRMDSILADLGIGPGAEEGRKGKEPRRDQFSDVEDLLNRPLQSPSSPPQPAYVPPPRPAQRPLPAVGPRFLFGIAAGAATMGAALWLLGIV